MRCSICLNEIEVVGDWAEGHRASPITDGRCCGKCNTTIVLPVRLGRIPNPRHRVEEAYKIKR